MEELVFVESLGIVLGLTFVLIVIGIVVIIILVLIFYQYKAKLIRQARERNVQQLRRNRSRSTEEEETIDEESQHTTATTHRGEAPPAYEEAIVSKDYRSISLESLNKLENINSESRRDSKIEKGDVTEIHHCNDEALPPPYISDTPTRHKTQ